MAKVLMKGNEALAESCLRAGCRFFSGYPITPQTEILEYLCWRMDEVGGDCVQTESELAGVNMLLGAAAGGKASPTCAAAICRRSSSTCRESETLWATSSWGRATTGS